MSSGSKGKPTSTPSSQSNVVPHTLSGHTTQHCDIKSDIKKENPLLNTRRKYLIESILQGVVPDQSNSDPNLHLYLQPRSDQKHALPKIEASEMGMNIVKEEMEMIVDESDPSKRKVTLIYDRQEVHLEKKGESSNFINRQIITERLAKFTEEELEELAEVMGEATYYRNDPEGSNQQAFFTLANEHVNLEINPTPRNLVGRQLLKDGLFLLAFVKLMEKIHPNKEDKLEELLLESVSKLQIETNVKEFWEGYCRFLGKQQERLQISEERREIGSSESESNQSLESGQIRTVDSRVVEDRITSNKKKLVRSPQSLGEEFQAKRVKMNPNPSFQSPTPSHQTFGEKNVSSRETLNSNIPQESVASHNHHTKAVNSSANIQYVTPPANIKPVTPSKSSFTDINHRSNMVNNGVSSAPSRSPAPENISNQNQLPHLPKESSTHKKQQHHNASSQPVETFGTNSSNFETGQTEHHSGSNGKEVIKYHPMPQQAEKRYTLHRMSPRKSRKSYRQMYLPEENMIPEELICADIRGNGKLALLRLTKGSSFLLGQEYAFVKLKFYENGSFKIFLQDMEEGKRLCGNEFIPVIPSTVVIREFIEREKRNQRRQLSPP